MPRRRGWVVFVMMGALSMSAQTPTAGSASLPEFEVASIKANVSGSNAPILRPLPDGLRATDCTLQMLTTFAFGPFLNGGGEVVSLPKWAESAHFDIVAKVSNADAEALRGLDADGREIKLRLMLRSLLIDRFKLHVHNDARNAPALALIAAKGGLKAKEEMPNDPELPNGALRIAKGKITGTGISMERLARALGAQMHQPVIDRTQLPGTYTFVLEWPIENGAGSSGEDTLHQASDSALFSALQEQVGLKLISASVQVEVLVVDHVEKPSAN